MFLGGFSSLFFGVVLFLHLLKVLRISGNFQVPSRDEEKELRQRKKKKEKKKSTRKRRWTKTFDLKKASLSL